MTPATGSTEPIGLRSRKGGYRAGPDDGQELLESGATPKSGSGDQLRRIRRGADD